MTPVTFLGLLPLLVGLFAVQSPDVEQTVSRLVNDDEVVWRVPVQPRPRIHRLQWLEREGPKCIRVGNIRRAMLSGAEQVDFVMATRRRIRAQFEADCPALDFYGGLYLQPDDERLCAGRDVVHSRMGGSCTIERFKFLVPQAVPSGQ